MVGRGRLSASEHMGSEDFSACRAMALQSEQLLVTLRGESFVKRVLLQGLSHWDARYHTLKLLMGSGSRHDSSQRSSMLYWGH